MSFKFGADHMDLKPNLLIIGASGLLGGNLARHFAERYRVTGIYHKNKPSIPGVKLIRQDLSIDETHELDAFEAYSPDYIIHCAGEANLDICERDPDYAQRHILGMTKSVAELAKKHDAYLISISTDAVSDGSREYLKESDVLSPINVYGRTKVFTEQYLMSEHGSSMVVRTRFYGINVANETSFTEHLIRELAQSREVACFTDNYCTQIYAMNLAEILEECMKKALFGIFNIVEDKKYSRFDYARLVAEVFGFDQDLIVPSSMSEMNFVAPRPPDTSLSNAKIKAKIDTAILPTAEGLAKMKKDGRRWR